MTLGLKRGTVALFPHEKAWETEAAETISLLRNVLGDVAVDIQHVGSTAVPSIMAKPIIDIAVAVRDLGDALAMQDALLRAGFYFRPASALSNQLLFARGSYYGGVGDLQTHFIHFVRADENEWRNYLLFRDYLRSNTAAAKEYEALKLCLAEECPVDAGREHYTAGKHAFITQTLRKALIWYFLGKKIRIVIDRPMGHVHTNNNFTLVYPVNYGYLPGVAGGDGEPLDVYLLGVNKPVEYADCRVIGAVYRKDDIEDKLIAAPDGVAFTKEEMEAAVRFQEQWFITETVTADL